MSLFERVRNPANPANSLAVGSPRSSKALAGGRLRWSSAVAGGSAALVSMLVIALPVLVAWVASPRSTVDWPQALSVGCSIWLLANGAPLSAGPATISLTPLLLTVIPLAVAVVAARRLVRHLRQGRPRRISGRAGLGRDVVNAGLAFVGGYAVTGLVVAVATAGEPLHAWVTGSVVAAAVAGGVAVLTAVALELRGELGSVAPGLTRALEARLPLHLRRAIRPGLWGASAIFGAGLVLTLGMVVMHWSRIGRLYDTLGADPVGATLLTLAQLTALPNVALWAASWIAGPGFVLGQGTAVTWSHADLGLLPLIPGLGALPSPGPLPAGLWLSVLVPVAAGALVGWRALKVVARLSSWQVKARVAGSGCLVAAAILTLASALADGTMGAGRLRGVGAPSLTFGASVLAELLLGASVVVGLSHLRATRS